MIIYDLQEEYKIKKLCKYLKVSTSGYYRWIKMGRPIRYSFDEWLADEIEKIFYETKKGYRFIKDEIFRRYGVVYNDKTIYKYMKILGLSSPIRKKRFQCCTKEDPNENGRYCSFQASKNSAYSVCDGKPFKNLKLIDKSE
jgi:transposase